jgi:hypothetical protein
LARIGSHREAFSGSIQADCRLKIEETFAESKTSLALLA